MAETVYLLGAGFNCSIKGTGWRRDPPLSRNFFQLLLQSDFQERLDAIRRNLYVDTLFELIDSYWHLSVHDLETAPFDIEECLTLFESIAEDARTEDERLVHARASYALKLLLLMYLGEAFMYPTSPTAMEFGARVIRESADVLTLNYDTAAENCLTYTGGEGERPTTASLRQVMLKHGPVPDEDLDASDFGWKRSLAYGFEFDEVPMPTNPSVVVPGSRYYKHPRNQLYAATRVLKLHGSVDWLQHTGRELHPGMRAELGAVGDPPAGLVLDEYTSYWNGEAPQREFWLMEPSIIPPVLNKRYNVEPYRSVWDAALSTLSEAKTLIVVGYSFPATDFRVRRLFREAFAGHSLRSLVVVNPDSDVVNIVRDLSGFDGPVETCDNLRSLYGTAEEF